jgi:glycosyltransferase involved in cell wall biosynthesis
MAHELALALPFMGGGGTERVVLALMKDLPRTRFRSTLYLFERKGPLIDRIPSHVEVVDLQAPRLRRAGPRLFAELRRKPPDIVFSTLGYINLAMLAMRPFLPKRPRLVLREPNTPSLSLPNLAFSRSLAVGYRLLYPFADAIVCQSDWMARELAEDFDVPTRLLRRIPNPVDVDALRADAATPLRHPDEGSRFVAAGRLTKQKGLDRLLPWFAAMPPDARLAILGEGPDGPALKAQAEELGLSARVDFAGFVANPAPMIAGADALLLPSRWEGMPNAALEALALGTPVIGTPESGGLAEVAEDCAAVTLASAGDSFIEAMRRVRLAPTTSLRPSLLPSRFEIGRVVEAYASLLEGGT